MRYGLLREVVVILAIGALLPVAASAGESQIRVLFLSPRLSGPDSKEAIDDLEAAIRADGGPLLVVGELAKADILVEIASLKRGTSDAGEPSFCWEGHYMPLASPREARVGARARATAFSIVMAGREAGPSKAAAILARGLAKVLGRETRANPPDLLQVATSRPTRS